MFLDRHTSTLYPPVDRFTTSAIPANSHSNESILTIHKHAARERQREKKTSKWFVTARKQ